MEDIFASLSWKTCRGKAPHAAGGDAIIAPKKTGNPAKRRCCLSGAIMMNIANDIERHYLKMLTQAKREVIIANAYFFPGYRLLHAMRKAARRGVRVKLVIQGEPDMPIVKVGARLLYNYLVKGGVHVYEYRRRPLHGKVALMDDHWGDRRLQQPRSAQSVA
ncbi:cardiolipin synthase 2 [Citrobacter koseri]|uniref:Cardiolipin synthase 2 n=1 Tax=Citrobacter koseri TaxID=545 RepID=A0A2X2UR84_CITKO|nr:cardiolipin synthase 2 [Citrobacter koseri]